MTSTSLPVWKWRNGRYVAFEGSYGFGRDRVATGWQAASLRALDEARSRPFQPSRRSPRGNPLAPGQVVAVDIALGPSSTLFRRSASSFDSSLQDAGSGLASRSPVSSPPRAAPSGAARARCAGDRNAPAGSLLPVIAGRTRLLGAQRAEELAQLGGQQLRLLDAGKWPPLGISTQRWMLYSRSAHGRGARFTSRGKMAHPVGTSTPLAVAGSFRPGRARSTAAMRRRWSRSPSTW